MKTKCPHCGQHYEVDAADVGKDADCTNCGKRFLIEASMSAEPSILDSPPPVERGKDSPEAIDAIVRQYLRPGDGEWMRQVLEIVIRERKASTSYFQRRLRLGYNQATDLVDELERRGIISGPIAGSSKREILLPNFQYAKPLKASDSNSADSPLKFEWFYTPPNVPMPTNTEQKRYVQKERGVMSFCAWALMVVAIVSSFAKGAFGFPEIFFELAAIFILLARPRGSFHAQ